MAAQYCSTKDREAALQRRENDLFAVRRPAGVVNLSKLACKRISLRRVSPTVSMIVNAGTPSTSAATTKSAADGSHSPADWMYLQAVEVRIGGSADHFPQDCARDGVGHEQIERQAIAFRHEHDAGGRRG